MSINPFDPLIKPLQPLFELVGEFSSFIIHHPVVAATLILCTVFLGSGLVQTLMDWSRKFWDSIFSYSAKFVKFLLLSIWSWIKTGFNNG